MSKEMLKDLKDIPAAKPLLDMLLYEALQPITANSDTQLAIKIGRRNLAVELLTAMEVIK